MIDLNTVMEVTRTRATYGHTNRYNHFGVVLIVVAPSCQSLKAGRYIVDTHNLIDIITGIIMTDEYTHLDHATVSFDGMSVHLWVSNTRQRIMTPSTANDMRVYSSDGYNMCVGRLHYTSVNGNTSTLMASRTYVIYGETAYHTGVCTTRHYAA